VQDTFILHASATVSCTYLYFYVSIE